MAWKEIIGQQRVKKILQRSIVEKRAHHAYFFWGLEGIGKDALALEFAKTVNCKKPIIDGETIEACNECSSCKKADNMQHPNIQYICSLPAGKGTDSRNDGPYSKLNDDQIALIQEELKHKSKNPYHRIAIPNANQIRVSSIRHVKRSLALGASESGRRCIIISNADEMNTESANAFLKTLEEPHDNITILITCSRHELILPTILSRCQQVFCEPLSEEDIAATLESKYSISEAEAKLAAAFSQGSFTKALEYLDEDMKKFRELVVNAFRISLKKHIFRTDLYAFLDEIIKQKDKNKTRAFLVLLLIWMRDAFILSLNGDVSKVLNIDQADMLDRFAKNFRDKNFPLAIATIEKSISRIYKNVQIQLILISMFVELRKIFL